MEKQTEKILYETAKAVGCLGRFALHQVRTRDELEAPPASITYQATLPPKVTEIPTTLKLREPIELGWTYTPPDEVA